ncbi:MAG TPA: hypothetical protein DCL42_09850 [Deltaproteobacteria bacterium]|nr:hypothetical protein [Deltaproteobacteria bacterium]
MIVVSDATPIILLAKLSDFEFLKKLRPVRLDMTVQILYRGDSIEANRVKGKGRSIDHIMNRDKCLDILGIAIYPMVAKNN